MRKSLIAVAVLSALLPTGCAQIMDLAGRPSLEDVRQRITGIDLKGIDLAFDVDIKNPYVFALKSPRFRYAVAVEGSELLSGDAPGGVDLPAGSVGTVTLPVRLAYLDLWREAKKYLDAEEVSYTLSAAAVLSAMGKSYELPVSHRGKIPILRPPTFTNLNLKLSDLSVRGTRVTLAADIVNPNAFDIGLKGLGYELKLGDFPVGNVAASTGDTIGAGKTGKLVLEGRLEAAAAVKRLLLGRSLGVPRIAATGTLKTPYGEVEMK